MTDDIDLTPEYIDNVCRAAPFADNDAGIPQMVALIRALSARLAALEAAKWNVQHTDTMNSIVQIGMARDQAEARAEALAAELAQAVEGLRHYSCDCGDLCEGTGSCGDYARSIIAKIGEGHE